MRFENVAKIQHYPLKNNRPVGESSRGVGAASEVKQPTFGRLAGPAAQRGFTIVELLIVIVVIAILAAISIVAYTGMQNRAHDSAVQSDLRATLGKILEYQAIHGGLPPTAVDTRAAIWGPIVQATKNSYHDGNSYIYCANASTDLAVIVGRSKSGSGFYAGTRGSGKLETWPSQSYQQVCPAVGASTTGLSTFWAKSGSWANWVQ